MAPALAVAIVAAISVLCSVFLASTAQGITVLMIFGAGLTAGLLGQIGRALNSGTLHSIARLRHGHSPSKRGTRWGYTRWCRAPEA